MIRFENLIIGKSFHETSFMNKFNSKPVKTKV